MRGYKHGAIVGVAIAAMSVGCYQTVVQTAPLSATAPIHQDRQWFTVGGLVGLSPPAGEECAGRGINYSSSRMGGMDFLINVGLGLAGGLIGISVCDTNDDPETYGACMSGIATAVPFLLSTRTVTYQCAGIRPGPIPRQRTGTTGSLPAPSSDVRAAAHSVFSPGN